MLACSIDGQPCAAAAAMIPVDDHGFLYGDGVFEGLRFYDHCIFRLDAHLDRIEDSARALAIRLPMDRAALARNVQATIAAAGVANGYVRLIVTRGSGPMGIDPSTCTHPRTIVIVDELVMVAPEKRKAGVAVIIASTRRLAPDQLDARIKSLNYLNQIMARLEARAAGADEAIILNTEGRVAEGSADNVFIVRHGTILTPPTTDGALQGITRGAIMDVAARLGIPCREQSLMPFDLYTADECFLTGTGAELIPVASIVGRPIGTGPLFSRIATGFAELIKVETAGPVARRA